MAYNVRGGTFPYEFRGKYGKKMDKNCNFLAINAQNDPAGSFLLIKSTMAYLWNTSAN